MIRVIRVLEYEFDSPEVAKYHLERLHVPLNGTWSPQNDHMLIRSATIIDLDPKESDAPSIPQDQE